MDRFWLLHNFTVSWYWWLWLVGHYFAQTDTSALIAPFFIFLRRYYGSISWHFIVSVNITTNWVISNLWQFGSDLFKFHRSSQNLTLNPCTWRNDILKDIWSDLIGCLQKWFPPYCPNQTWWKSGQLVVPIGLRLLLVRNSHYVYVMAVWILQNSL